MLECMKYSICVFPNGLQNKQMVSVSPSSIAFLGSMKEVPLFSLVSMVWVWGRVDSSDAERR